MRNIEDLKNEVWVRHPLGIMVSNMGRVWTARNGKHYGYKDSTPYLKVGWNGKMYQVHRLICDAFKENPNNYKEVDHINRIKTDNRIENLRWADRPMQMKNREVDWKAMVTHTDYKVSQAKRIEKVSIPILQLNKNMEVIREWKSATEAAREGGFNNSNICNCLKGRYKTASGFVWRYKNKNGEAS